MKIMIAMLASSLLAAAGTGRAQTVQSVAPVAAAAPIPINAPEWTPVNLNGELSWVVIQNGHYTIKADSVLRAEAAAAAGVTVVQTPVYVQPTILEAPPTEYVIVGGQHYHPSLFVVVDGCYYWKRDMVFHGGHYRLRPGVLSVSFGLAPRFFPSVGITIGGRVYHHHEVEWRGNRWCPRGPVMHAPPAGPGRWDDRRPPGHGYSGPRTGNYQSPGKGRSGPGPGGHQGGHDRR